MIKKRGQVTIFLILGVVIVFVIALYFFVAGSSVEKKSKSAVTKELEQSDAAVVRFYVESCIKMVAEDALFNRIGLQGGYIDTNPNPLYGESGVPNPPTAAYLDNLIPYYLEADCATTPCTYAENTPTLDAIKAKLANYVMIEFENCFKPSTFEEIGLKITRLGTKNAEVSINKEDVSVKLNYQLTIKGLKDQKTISIDSFSVILPIRLKALHESSKELVNKIISTPNAEYTITSSDCDSFDKNGLTNIYIKTSDDGSKIVQLVDFSTYLEHYFNSYIFQFALKNININGGCVG